MMKFLQLRPHPTYRHVRRIKFDRVRFTPEHLQWVKECISDHVVDLTFEQCHLPAKLIEVIASCPELTHLTIRSTYQLDWDYDALVSRDLEVLFQGRAKILHINLEGCSHIRFKDCSDLVNRSDGRIEGLQIGYVSGLTVKADFTDEKVESVFSQLPNLTSLSLRGFVLLSDSHLKFILRQCPLLQHLDIECCIHLTNDSLQHISGFVSLDLALYRISCEVLIAIISKCPDLKRLTVGISCDDLVLSNLGLHCRDLREFNVVEGHHITVAGVMSLLHNCRSLEKVQLRGAELITSSDLVQIAESLSMCPSLKGVIFRDGQPFPLEGLLSVIRNCSSLTVLRFNFDTDVDMIAICRLLSKQARALRSLRFAALHFETSTNENAVQQKRDLKQKDALKYVTFDALGFVLGINKRSCFYSSSGDCVAAVYDP